MDEMKDKKARILLAAMEIFSQRPYHQVRMDEIADRAGVGKGTVYSYFKSKEDLFTQMIQEGASVYFREALNAISGKETVREKLYSLFHHHLNFVEKHAAAARIIAGERRMPHIGLEAAKARHKQMERFVCELLEEGMESGEFRPIDTSVVTGIILGTFSALLMSILFSEHKIEETEQTVDKILDFYQFGLVRYE